MRSLPSSGKGGVGKTSVAAATGVRLSALGYKTLVMSVDPAHSLGGSFDLEDVLFHGSTGDPKPVHENLRIQEVNIQREIKRHWSEIAGYITSVLRTCALSDVEAEEMARRAVARWSAILNSAAIDAYLRLGFDHEPSCLSRLSVIPHNGR